jgi:hypothetical protein
MDNKLALWLVIILLSCTPAERAGVPVLSTIDAVGKGVAHVLGWCEENGADVEAARKAAADRDYVKAIELAKLVVAGLREAGQPIPEDTEVLLRLAEGAAAAEAIQSGMRALSGGPK